MFNSYFFTDHAQLALTLYNKINDSLINNIVIYLPYSISPVSLYHDPMLTNYQYCQNPVFNVNEMARLSVDKAFTIEYLDLLFNRFRPETSKIAPHWIRSTEGYPPKTLKEEVQNHAKRIKEVLSCVSSIMKETNNQTILSEMSFNKALIQVDNIKSFFALLFYINHQFDRNNIQSSTIWLIDPRGYLFNEAHTNLLMPVLSRLLDKHVMVTHNHCNYAHCQSEWFANIIKGIKK